MGIRTTKFTISYKIKDFEIKVCTEIKNFLTINF